MTSLNLIRRWLSPRDSKVRVENRKSPMPELPYAAAHYKLPSQCTQAQTIVFIAKPELSEYDLMQGHAVNRK